MVLAHGFFTGRRSPDFGLAPFATGAGLIGYANVPPIVGMVVSSKHATLYELQTVYGVRDLYNLAELVAVDAHNARALTEAQQNANGN